MSTPEYIAAAKEFIKLTGLKAGSTVRVTHKVKDQQHGWGTKWNANRMDDAVGETFKVERICNRDYDIGLDLGVDTYYFPFFCLEVLDNPIVVKLDSGEYKAIIQENGNIKVGCQEISYKTLEKIFVHAYEAKYDCELILPK